MMGNATTEPGGSKRRSPKTPPDRSTSPPIPYRIKVFWFFFSKKNALLALACLWVILYADWYYMPANNAVER